MKKKKTFYKNISKRSKETRKIPFGNPSSTFRMLVDNGTIDDLEVLKDGIQAINYAILLNDGFTSNWIEIKKLIHSFCSDRFRRARLLSRRDEVTKKQKPNDFDYAVMNYWKEKTGQELFIPENDLMDSNHVYRPRGWNILVHNELALINKYKKENNKEPQREYSKEQYGKYTKAIRDYFSERKKIIKRNNQVTS